MKRAAAKDFSKIDRERQRFTRVEHQQLKKGSFLKQVFM
jgi:hypothetical protein